MVAAVEAQEEQFVTPISSLSGQNFFGTEKQPRPSPVPIRAVWSGLLDSQSFLLAPVLARSDAKTRSSVSRGS